MAYQTNFKNKIHAGGASAFLHADVQEGAVATGVTTQPGKLINFNTSGEIAAPNDSSRSKVVLEKTSNVGGSVEDIFVEGDQLDVAFPRNSELFNLLVKSTFTTTMYSLYGCDSDGLIVPATDASNVSATFFECQENTAASAADRLVLFKAI